MANIYSGRKDFPISDGDKDCKYFVKKILQLNISLYPRGYAGDSFRFYELMQLGVVPLLLGHPDTRPFKKYIDWDDISFFVKTTEELVG